MGQATRTGTDVVFMQNKIFVFTLLSLLLIYLSAEDDSRAEWHDNGTHYFLKAIFHERVEMRKILGGEAGVIGLSMLLSACTTPFSQPLTMNWSGPPGTGTIAVSQPKLYRRASLINERQLDVQWIDELIGESKTIPFESELVRELEQITSFATGLGLSFNPASGVAYRRADETGNIQQQVDVLKLQLQLDQLKRDAELLRGGFAAQTAPLNAELGKIGNAAATQAASDTLAPSIAQLNAAIERLGTGLASRLDADAKKINRAETGTNPADTFRDRSAYRDLLKAARNSASLDDAHDYRGNALVRLNFQAMVLPDREKSRVPGVIQMTVVKPDLNNLDIERTYKGWLDHVNLRLNQKNTADLEINQVLLDSAIADNFDLIAYRYAPEATPATSQARTKKSGKKVPKESPASSPLHCDGLSVQTSSSDNCSVLSFAVAKYGGGSIQEGAYSTLQRYADWFFPAKDESWDKQQYLRFHGYLTSTARQQSPRCAMPTADLADPDSERNKLLKAISEAQNRVAAGEVIIKIDRTARRILAERGIKAPADDVFAQLVRTRAERAQLFLLTFERQTFAGCDQRTMQSFRDKSVRLFIPPAFREALFSTERVAIYEIGPREEVQHVSTVSRVANNLSLAASLAAASPGTGAAANAAVAYSRQTIGKAAALERVPQLIGYSTTDKTFGWVIAPTAVLDPHGAVELEQRPRTLDLSVDLSVPGWWPKFTIETVTGWGVAQASISTGTVDFKKMQPDISVAMAPNYADFDALTILLQNGDLQTGRRAALDDPDLKGQAVSACRTADVYLAGPSIWRATMALVGGYRLDASAIKVAPDMSGIVLTVPALDELIGTIAGPKLPVSIFTRDGEAPGEIDYIPRPVPNGCKVKGEADADQPTISSLLPTRFRAGTELWFEVAGSKLGKINRVTLNGQPGSVRVAKDGKSLQAQFAATQTESLPLSRTIALSFFNDSKKLGEQLVEASAKHGGK